jgi:hypothetical protein
MLSRQRGIRPRSPQFATPFGTTAAGERDNCAVPSIASGRCRSCGSRLPFAQPP